ncbi:mannose-1-phosphate guanyltransferase [candidate division WOR-3 bacterium]|nr:mannose-1-phosphate guanyltransferase [candidate division WOR-3 bacterium]
MRLYAVILCGGRGERFWPKSRRGLPKQFIRLFGPKSLTEQTSERIAPLCPAGRQLFVAPAEFSGLMRRAGYRRQNVIYEPAGRNTAPAIGLAAACLHRRDPEATMVVLPADHLIEDRRAFLAAVRLAAGLAGSGKLVTFGVMPTRPDTGYGYVQVGKRIAGRGRLTGHDVLGFREKPDSATAKRYVASGDYLWNSGMFVWRVADILEAFRRFMPGFLAALARFGRHIGGSSEQAELARLYRAAPSISIDYAVMEKADNVAAVRAGFDWDDVGSWPALARHFPADRQGNVLRGDCFALDSTRCIVDSDQGVVGLLGVSDLVVVRSGDALLVARAPDVGRVKELLKLMAAGRGGRSYL